MSRRASAQAKSIHTKLLTDLSNYISPLVNQNEYDQFQNRLRDLLKPIEQRQSKNIMDMLQILEKRGVIAVGKYDVIKARLIEFDVNLGDMIDDAVEEINNIERQNEVVTSSDSSSANKEHKERTDLEDNVGGASPVKRSRSDKPRYAVEKQQKGLMLVFNFEKDRQGTHMDVEKIRIFFETELNFEFELCKDYTKQQVIEKLEEFQEHLSGKKNARTYYCFFLVLMGHGKEDSIMTADEEKTYIEFDTIFSYYKNDKIKDFAGKPRVFLIQSCRGSDTQKTVDLPDEPPEDETMPPEDQIGKVTIPTDSDTLIAHATTPGTKAFRRQFSDVGAWFIDAFIDICRGSYREDHLEEMLISVREKVAYDQYYRTNSGGCQMPCVWTTLTKRLFLEKP